MKTGIRIILLSISFAIVIWIVDAILDSIFFTEKTFWELLILDLPENEIYHRLLELSIFILFGFIAANMVNKRRNAEEEAISGKEFLDAIINSSPFAMWISDNEGKVIRTNPSLCKAINLSDSQITGKYNVLNDKNLEIEGTMPMVKAVFEKLEPARFVMPWKVEEVGDVDFEGAHDMFIDVSMFPIINQKGTLTNVVCQWFDISSQKKIQSELVELKNKLETKVNQRTEELNSKIAELETFYDFAVERELKMEEMRKQLDQYKISMEKSHENQNKN